MNTNGDMGSHNSLHEAGVARFGPYEADFEQHELRRNGVRIRLQDQPFKLLRVLLENQNRIVSREELRQKLWPSDIFVKFDACLNTAFNKLRHALQEDPDRALFIETIPREGYRFIAPVSWIESAVSPQLSSLSAVVASERKHADTIAPPQGTFRARLLGRNYLQRVGATALLCLAAIAVMTLFSRVPSSRSSASKRQKIVVLVMPFDDLTADHSQDYLSAGFTEEMITQLGAKYPRCLAVLSRPSAIQLKAARVPLARVAPDLGVDYVLAGSVRRSEDHLRITAQLFRAPDQTSIWAGTYDVESSRDTIAVESQVSTHIADALALEIVPYGY